MKMKLAGNASLPLPAERIRPEIRPFTVPHPVVSSSSGDTTIVNGTYFQNPGYSSTYNRWVALLQAPVTSVCCQCELL